MKYWLYKVFPMWSFIFILITGYEFRYNHENCILTDTLVHLETTVYAMVSPLYELGQLMVYNPLECNTSLH